MTNFTRGLGNRSKLYSIKSPLKLHSLSKNQPNAWKILCTLASVYTKKCARKFWDFFNLQNLWKIFYRNSLIMLYWNFFYSLFDTVGVCSLICIHKHTVTYRLRKHIHVRNSSMHEIAEKRARKFSIFQALMNKHR